jgi:hypothetical protein
VILQVPPFDTIANKKDNSDDILLKRALFTDLRMKVVEMTSIRGLFWAKK